MNVTGVKARAWCPLCGQRATVFHQDGSRCYFRCDECQLVHLDRGLWPTPDEERRRYLLPEGGLLAIMTGLRSGEQPFATWWYRRDPTHVCFYSAETLAWIAARRGWALEEPAPGVALFRLPERTAS